MDFSEIHCLMHFQHLGDFLLLLLSISTLIIVSSKHSEWFPLFDKFSNPIHCQYWQMFQVHVRKTWNVQFELTNLSCPSSLPMSLHRLWLHPAASWLLQSWHLLPRGGYGLTQPAHSLLPLCNCCNVFIRTFLKKIEVSLIYNIVCTYVLNPIRHYCFYSQYLFVFIYAEIYFLKNWSSFLLAFSWPRTPRTGIIFYYGLRTPSVFPLVQVSCW